MKMFHNFPVKRKSNVLEKVLFHCGLRETKRRNLKNCHRGRNFKNLLCVVQISKILIHHLKYIYFSYICTHTYIYLHVFWRETPDCVPTIWEMMARGKSACKDTSFMVKEQSQPVTKCCCLLALPPSATGFSFTLHTKVILQFASYFPRL